MLLLNVSRNDTCCYRKDNEVAAGVFFINERVYMITGKQAINNEICVCTIAFTV
jgi:hypothetical protein